MKLDRHFIIHLPPPIIAVCLLGAAGFIHGTLPSLEILPATPVGGFVWGASGLSLATLAALQFKALRTTVLPMGSPSKLVTLGAYLWTRNPMYLGVLTTLIGFALFMGTLPFFLVPWLFFLTVNRVHIPYEETKLIRQFGETYERYARRVNRWL